MNSVRAYRVGITIFIILGVMSVVVIYVRSILTHPDFKGMAVTGFANDLLDYLDTFDRFPNSWADYGQWYDRAHPTGRRNAEWAKSNFEILVMGNDLSILGQGSMLIKIINPEWIESEQYINDRLNYHVRQISAEESTTE